MALESLSEAQDRLAAVGFGDDLVASGGLLRSVRTGETHDPATLAAVEIIRFEGVSDPDDEAVLVAVSTRDGDPLGTFTAPYGPSASAAEAEILQHLSRIVVSGEHESHHGAHDHVAAIFADRASAEAAVDALRSIGLGSEHLGVAVRHADTVVFEHDEQRDMAEHVALGVGAGSVLGFLGGMLLFAVAVPGVGTLGAGGLAALGVGSGISGALVGTILGVASASEDFDEHQRLRETPLQPGEVLVVACAHAHEELVQRELRRHGGRLLPPHPRP